MRKGPSRQPQRIRPEKHRHSDRRFENRGKQHKRSQRYGEIFDAVGASKAADKYRALARYLEKHKKFPRAETIQRFMERGERVVGTANFQSRPREFRAKKIVKEEGGRAIGDFAEIRYPDDRSAWMMRYHLLLDPNVLPHFKDYVMLSLKYSENVQSFERASLPRNLMNLLKFLEELSNKKG